MKNLILLALYVLTQVISQRAFSQNSWSKINPIKSDFTSIIAYDGSHMSVGGKNSSMFFSADKGKSWKESIVTYPQSFNVKEICRRSSTVGIALVKNNSNNVLLESQNAGKSWKKMLFPLPQAELNDIDFIGLDTGFLAGKEGQFLRTENGGTSWASFNLSANFEIQSISFSSGKHGYCIAKSDSFYLLKTIDGGVNWTKIRKSINSMQNLVAFSNKDFVYSTSAFTNFTLYNQIYFSGDEGITFQLSYESPFNQSNNLELKKINSNSLVKSATANYQFSVLRYTNISENHGLTWETDLITSDTNEPSLTKSLLNCSYYGLIEIIDLLDDKKFTANIYDGDLYTSEKFKNTICTWNKNNMYILDKVSKTWNEILIVPRNTNVFVPPYLSEIKEATNNTVLYMHHGDVYHNVHKFDLKSKVSKGIFPFAESINTYDFYDTMRVVGLNSDNHTLHITKNGGLTSYTHHIQDQIKSIKWLSENKVFYSNGNTITMSSDTGNTWTETVQDIGNQMIHKIAFESQTTGYVLGKNLQFTENGGLTWKVDSSLTELKDLVCIQFMPNGDAVTVTKNGKLLKRNKINGTWTYIPFVDNYQAVRATITDDGSLFVVGQNSTETSLFEYRSNDAATGIFELAEANICTTDSIRVFIRFENTAPNTWAFIHLSDSTGSFANPTPIDSFLTGIQEFTNIISRKIDIHHMVAPGHTYKIRVVADQVDFGTESVGKILQVSQLSQSFAGPDKTVCQSELPLQFSGQPAGGHWVSPAVNQQGATPINLSANTYELVYINQISEQCKSKDTARLLVNRNPIKAELQLSDMLLFVDSTTLEEDNSIEWYYNQTIIPGMHNFNLNIQANGLYFGKISNPQQCYVNTDSILISEIGQLISNKTSILMPNPASTHVSVKTGNAYGQIRNIRCTDGLGRTHQLWLDKNTENGVQISTLRKGIYFLHFELNGILQSHKFIKN